MTRGTSSYWVCHDSVHYFYVVSSIPVFRSRLCTAGEGCLSYESARVGFSRKQRVKGRLVNNARRQGYVLQKTPLHYHSEREAKHKSNEEHEI